MFKVIFFFIFTSLFLHGAHASLLSAEQESRISFFMSRQQDIILKNEKNFKRLITRLERNQIVGLELIVASPTKRRFESRFGHSMLRIVDSYGSAGDDLVLNFVADVDSVELSKKKGLFGGYPVYPLLKPLREVNRDYLKKENRSLDRYIIPTNKEMREQLITVLEKEWQNLANKQKELNQKLSDEAKIRAEKKAIGSYADKPFNILALKDSLSNLDYGWGIVLLEVEKPEVVYIEPVDFQVAFSNYFKSYKLFSNNCLATLIDFLKDLDFPAREKLLFAGRIPVKTSAFFEKSMLTPFPKVIIPNFLGELNNKLAKVLSVSSNLLSDSDYWPSNAAARIIKDMSLNEKMLILDNYKNIQKSTILELTSSLPPLSLRPSYEELYGISDLPLNLYEICPTKACAEQVIETRNATWSKSDLYEKKDRLKKIIKKIKKNKLSESLNVRPEFTQHFKYLFNL